MRNEAIKLENIAKSEPRNFWKSIKKSYNQEKNNQDSPIKIQDFYEHFEDLYENVNINDRNDNSDSNTTHIADVELDNPITMAELKTAVLSQNNGNNKYNFIKYRQSFIRKFHIS